MMLVVVAVVGRTGRALCSIRVHCVHKSRRLYLYVVHGLMRVATTVAFTAIHHFEIFSRASIDACSPKILPPHAMLYPGICYGTMSVRLPVCPSVFLPQAMLS